MRACDADSGRSELERLDGNGCIQERGDLLEAALGRGAEPAIGAHAAEAFGQDMLEEAAQELPGGQAQRLFLARAGVALGERDALIVLGQEPGAGKGGLVKIAGKIAQRFGPAFPQSRDWQ